MLPGIEQLGCGELAVPATVMQHVVAVESSYNPFAIGVVGGRLARQPRSLDEAVATVRMLEEKGRNFSLGLAQVNRHNLKAQGLENYAHAFDACRNLAAGARILDACHKRAGGDWNKAFSCYYSGNFVTGFRHGYVQKIHASMRAGQTDSTAAAIPLARTEAVASRRASTGQRSPSPQVGSAAINPMADPAPPGSEPSPWPSDATTHATGTAVATVIHDPSRPAASASMPKTTSRAAGDDAFVF